MARQATIPLPFPPPSWRFSKWQRRLWRDSEDLHGPDLFDLCCGRGVGKDIGAIRCCIRDGFKLWGERQREKELAKRNPRIKIPSREPLVKVFVIAPREDNLTQPWADWEGELRGLAREWNATWLDTDDDAQDSTSTDWLFRHVVRERKFVLLGRGEIEIEARLSSTRDSLRGPGVDIAHWTEFATETTEGEIDRAYDTELIGTLTRVGRLGRVYRTTTPKGQSGAYYARVKKDFGEDAYKLENGVLRSLNGRGFFYNFDSFQNDFLTDAQRAKIREEASMGWIYEQERLARFVIGDRGGSAVYEREWLMKNFRGKPHWSPSRNVVVGVDIARFGDDWTVFVVVDFDTGDIIRIERYQVTTGPEIVAHIERLAREFGIGSTEFVMDQTAQQAFVGDFINPAVRVTGLKMYDRDKERMVLQLKHLLQIERVHLQDPDNFPFRNEAEREAARALFSEALQFLKIVDQLGRIRYSHPRGTNDDTLMAWIYAVDPIARSMSLTGPLEGLPPNLRAILGA